MRIQQADHLALPLLKLFLRERVEEPRVELSLQKARNPRLRSFQWHEPGVGLPRLGDDYLLACMSTVDQLREVGLRLVNIDLALPLPHDMSLVEQRDLVHQ